MPDGVILTKVEIAQGEELSSAYDAPARIWNRQVSKPLRIERRKGTGGVEWWTEFAASLPLPRNPRS